MADRDSHPMPPSGPTNGTAPTVLAQGSGGTLSSQLYSDYDRSNHMDLDELQGGCYDE